MAFTAFTVRELEIARRVVASSKAARQWAVREARAFNVNVDTQEGRAYVQRAQETYANKSLRGVR